MVALVPSLGDMQYALLEPVIVVFTKLTITTASNIRTSQKKLFQPFFALRSTEGLSLTFLGIDA
jgi:hypothetical protein